MPIRGVLFDLDGTVVENAYDWGRIRAELGAGSRPILSYLEDLPEAERGRKRAVLERHEAEQTARSVLRDGIPGLLAGLRARGVKTALITNNSLANAGFLLRKFDLAFDLVMTRESGLWKPSGAPFREAARRLGLAPADCCAVGDTRFDVLAAREAGVPLVLLLTERPEDFAGPGVEVFSTVADLQSRLEAAR